MQVEPGYTLRVIADGKEDTQPTLVHLLVNQKLGKASVDLVLGGDVCVEQVTLTTDRPLKRTRRLPRLRLRSIGSRN